MTLRASRRARFGGSRDGLGAGIFIGAAAGHGGPLRRIARPLVLRAPVSAAGGGVLYIYGLTPADTEKEQEILVALRSKGMAVHPVEHMERVPRRSLLLLNVAPSLP